MARRFPLALGALLLACLWAASPAGAQAPGEFMQKAVYKHTFAPHTFRVGPRDFKFLVDNLVGVLAVVSQPDFRRRHPRLAGFNPTSLGGSPSDFTLGVGPNQARVVMQWLDDKQLMYLAQATMQKLGLSISGRAMALLAISYDDPASERMTVTLTVGFQPSSAVLAAALKPMIDSFGQEMDRLGQRVLGLADDFLQVYQAERQGAFSRAGLLAQVARINQQRLELAARATGQPSPGAASDRGALPWVLALGGGVVLLLLGWGAGFLWADKRRGRREAKVLRRLARAQKEQNILDRQLAQGLKGQTPNSPEARQAWQERQRLSRDLAQEVARFAQGRTAAPGKGK